MSDLDFILIAQSEAVNYDEYSNLPLDRLDLYRELIYPRMVRYKGAFRSHVDLINLLRDGISFRDADFDQRRQLLSVWNLPSLSGMHLANFLLSHGYITEIINNFDSEWDRFQAAYSACSRPPLVGVSSTFHLSWSELRRITRVLRQLDPNMEIVVGGAFVNAKSITDPIESFARPMGKYGIKYVLHGFNSETDLLELLQERDRSEDMDRVPNLVYLASGKDGQELRNTPSRWNPPLLDHAPALWDGLNLPFVRHTVQLRSSVGCPFKCAFCSYPQVARGFHIMDAALLERSIQSVVRIPGVDRVVFVDDTFNVPRQRFLDICRMLSKYQVQWYSFLRVQFIDDETASLMRDSGCQAVYLGIESANDVVLKNMNKKATRAQFERGVKALRRHGIASVAAFVLGFPGETDDSIQDDIDFIENSGAEFYTLKEFYYMEHTAVHRDRERYGLSGTGNKWSHSTMDSTLAYEHKIRMFREVKNSTFVDPDTSLWHLVLLEDAGFSMGQIAAIQRQINLIMADQLHGSFDDHHPAFEKLGQIVASGGSEL